MTRGAWESGAAEAELVRLWQAYGQGLRPFEGVLGHNLCGRFEAEVLAPFRSPAPLQKVKAVAAWLRWRPEALRFAARPTGEDLAALRGRLTELLEGPASSGWFARRVSDPAVKTLLSDCRDAMDRVSRIAEVTGGPEFAALGRQATAADGLLETAPPRWGPGASLHLERLLGLLKECEDCGPLGEAGRRLVEYTRCPESGLPTAVSVSAADGFVALAQSAGPVGQIPSATAVHLDRILDCLRGWGAGLGVEFLPRAWSFAAPSSLAALRAEGVPVAAVYRPEEPAGTLIRLKDLGVAVQGGVVRDAVVTVSAGPAPPWFAELEELVANADHPAARELRERLRGWRDASLDGSIEGAALSLYVEFWDRLRADLADPDLAGAFADRLADVLREAFGFTPLFPANYQDHPPGWVQLPEGERMTTGRVREVLRPGLTDRTGELRVPARVVVE